MKTHFIVCYEGGKKPFSPIPNSIRPSHGYIFCPSIYCLRTARHAWVLAVICIHCVCVGWIFLSWAYIVITSYLSGMRLEEMSPQSKRNQRLIISKFSFVLSTYSESFSSFISILSFAMHFSFPIQVILFRYRHLPYPVNANNLICPKAFKKIFIRPYT